MADDGTVAGAAADEAEGAGRWAGSALADEPAGKLPGAAFQFGGAAGADADAFAADGCGHCAARGSRSQARLHSALVGPWPCGGAMQGCAAVAGASARGAVAKVCAIAGSTSVASSSGNLWIADFMAELPSGRAVRSAAMAAAHLLSCSPGFSPALQGRTQRFSPPPSLPVGNSPWIIGPPPVTVLVPLM